jgi:hypothetical protein
MKTIIKIRRNASVMPTPFIHSNGAVIGLPTRYAFLRHLNTSTLALVLFVAFALLGTTQAKESQNNEWIHPRETDAELVVRPSHVPRFSAARNAHLHNRRQKFVE